MTEKAGIELSQEQALQGERTRIVRLIQQSCREKPYPCSACRTLIFNVKNPYAQDV